MCIWTSGGIIAMGRTPESVPPSYLQLLQNSEKVAWIGSNMLLAGHDRKAIQRNDILRLSSQLQVKSLLIVIYSHGQTSSLSSLPVFHLLHLQDLITSLHHLLHTMVSTAPLITPQN